MDSTGASANGSYVSVAFAPRPAFLERNQRRDRLLFLTYFLLKSNKRRGFLERFAFQEASKGQINPHFSVAVVGPL